MIEKRLRITVLIFLTIIMVMFTLKPPVFWKKDGSLKSFGIGKNKTLFTLTHFALLISIVVYLVFL